MQGQKKEFTYFVIKKCKTIQCTFKQYEGTSNMLKRDYSTEKAIDILFDQRLSIVVCKVRLTIVSSFFGEHKYLFKMKKLKHNSHERSSAKLKFNEISGKQKNK